MFRTSRDELGRAKPGLTHAIVVGAAAVAAAACVPVAAQRLPQDVGAAIAEHTMRRLETADLQVYYPEGREIEAWRFVTRIEGCVDHLRRVAQVHNRVADQKIVAILPELAFNNAFVTPRISGYNTLAVVPTYDTLDMFSLEMGLPPDPAVIGCHEITHYVQFQQIAGFAWFWNLFGQVYTPQTGFDAWFAEGVDSVQLVLPPGRPEDELANVIDVSARAAAPTSSAI